MTVFRRRASRASLPTVTAILEGRRVDLLAVRRSLESEQVARRAAAMARVAAAARAAA